MTTFVPQMPKGLYSYFSSIRALCSVPSCPALPLDFKKQGILSDHISSTNIARQVCLYSKGQRRIRMSYYCES